MSALRNLDNDRQSASPFEHVVVAARRALANAQDARTDREAQETIEGGPAEPAEVPGVTH